MAGRTTKKEPVKTLAPRIHAKEFLKLYSNLSETQQAGFKVSVGKEWMRLEEWEKELKCYLDR